MIRQPDHDMLVARTHDENLRQDFVVNFREYLARKVASGNATSYEIGVKPSYLKEHGSEPQSREDMRKVMTRNPYYQFYSAMQRNCQEMMWDSVVDSLERELPDLMETAQRIDGKSGGTLTLDPNFEVPAYLASKDIHLQPGGYHASIGESDVSAGALYDRAIYLYTMGQWGPQIDYLGRTVIKHYQKTYPDKTPQRILELGCSAGNSVVTYAENYPDAEVHGIDVGESLLRYAHARAEGMGLKVHFSQQNAERTNFDDESFDLIVSHLFMHETSTRAVHDIFKECLRLLKPGGVMLHQDIPRFEGMPVLTQFLVAWEIYNVNEEFAGTYRDMDVVAEAIKAGFAKDKARLDLADHFKPPTVTNYQTSQVRLPVLVGEK